MSIFGMWFGMGLGLGFGLGLSMGGFAHAQQVSDYDQAQSVELAGQAAQALRQGDRDEARALYKRALLRNPDNFDARFSLAHLYLQTGDLLSAEKEARRTHSSQPSDLSEILLGQALIGLGRAEEALEVVSLSAASEAARVDKLDLRAGALMLLERFEEAGAVYQEALSLAPEHKPARLGLAQVAIAQNQPLEAQDRIDELLSIAPDFAPAWLLKGRNALAQGLRRAAFRYLDRAIALDPGEVDAYVERARAHLLAGAIAQAEQDAQLVRSVAPGSPVTLFLEASILFAKEDFQRADATYSRIASTFDDYAPALLLGGLIKAERGDLAQAEGMLFRYTKQHPSHDVALRALSEIRLRDDRPMAALEALAPLLSANPPDRQALRLAARADVLQGARERAAARFQQLADLPGEGREEAGEALAMALGDDAAWRILSVRERLAMGLERQAEEDILALEKMPGQEAAALTLRADLAAREGNDGRARSLLERVLREAPAYLPAHEAMALLERAQGADPQPRLQSALERSDYAPPLVRLAVRQFLNAGQPEAALAVTRQAWERHPQSGLLGRLMLELSLGGQNQQAAIETARRLARQARDPLGGPDFLAQQEAIKALAGLGAWPELAQLGTELIESGQNSVDLWLWRARAQLIIGAMGDFEQGLREALAAAPQQRIADQVAHWALARGDAGLMTEAAQARSPRDALQAAVFTAQARALSGDLNAALAALDALIARYPSEPAPVQAKAALLTRAGDNESAGDALRRAFQRVPEDARLLLAFTAHQITAGRFTEARDVLRAQLRKTPDAPALLNNLALALSGLGDGEALDYAQKAYRLAPSSAAIADSYGWLLAQEAGQEAGQEDALAQALDVLAKAHAAAPTSGAIAYHYGAVLAQAGQSDKARGVLALALRVDPDFAESGKAQALLASLGAAQ
ncbi:MAG: tetratricopeptide repeat protein [Neomegalonema sp.]|nr:tetratricopeptide repeat protein [Neomegalonema sp.]